MSGAGSADADRRSRLFELCLNVIEAEKRHSDDSATSSLQALVAAIREVSACLDTADEFILFQVSSLCPVFVCE